MSEQKVWVEKMPESCSKCEWCSLNHKDNYGRPFCLMARTPLYNGDKINEGRGQHKDSLSDFDCPLHSIKDHDRELVEKVIKEVEDSFTAYLPLRNRTGAWFYGRLNEILKNIKRSMKSEN